MGRAVCLNLLTLDVGPQRSPDSIAASAAASIRGAVSKTTPRGAPSSRARYSQDSERNSSSSIQVHSNPVA